MSNKITQTEVQHVAKLARLHFAEPDIERLTEQLNSILSYMEKLNQLDTEGVAPMTHAIELQNVFREDEVCSSIEREDALANAPASDGVSFLVPKVI